MFVIFNKLHYIYNVSIFYVILSYVFSSFLTGTPPFNKIGTRY